jgi:hypothetical protein
MTPAATETAPQMPDAVTQVDAMHSARDRMRDRYSPLQRSEQAIAPLHRFPAWNRAQR